MVLVRPYPIFRMQGLRTTKAPAVVALAMAVVSLAESRHFLMDDMLKLVGGGADHLDGLRDHLDAWEGLQLDKEDDAPHPVKVNNWGTDLHVGQVSGIAVNPADEPVIFHRGPVTWDSRSFDENNTLVDKRVIKEDTILVLSPDDGSVLWSFGSGTFYMPHGLAVDIEGNVYVTDVGLHQVFRFPAGKTEPDLVLGERFVPGQDRNHFCQPTAIAVSEANGDIFVADGYCNSRVLKFSRDGWLKNIINGGWNVPHSLALFESSDVLCVADREGRKVDCVKAGQERPMYANKDETGEMVRSYTGVGSPFAIAGKGSALLSISGVPPVRGLTIDTAALEPRILDLWGSDDDIRRPHDLAISLTGDAVYVAETNSDGWLPKVHKFDVVSLQDDR